MITKPDIKLTTLLYKIYMTVYQRITPPHIVIILLFNYYIVLHFPVFLKRKHNLKYNYIPFNTNKHIFFLGKNKFDRYGLWWVGI